MVDVAVDGRLSEWDEIDDGSWKSLLLGNGFSINIWNRFGYNSLYEEAQKPQVDTNLTEQSRALFERLNTTNFEDILRILYHAKLVDEQLQGPQVEQIDALYTNVKNSLAAAVHYSHVVEGFHSLRRINDALQSYRSIFSTNYDLVPYWAIMNKDTGRFRDLFWSADGLFDLNNTSVFGKATVIHYLHGALHLVEDSKGKTMKLTAREGERLSSLFDLDHPELFPLFIAEGSSETKLARIRKNDYLRFCYQKLVGNKEGVVVLGHSLHKDYDQHIIEALNESPCEKISVSVWPHQDAEDIIALKSRLHQELKGKSLFFFNSETHPLGLPDLRVQEG